MHTLGSRPLGGLRSASRQGSGPSSRRVACRFFKSKRPLDNNNGFTRKQLEDSIGGLLQTVTTPAPPAEESAPAPAPEEQQQQHHNGSATQGLHVIKPQTPIEAAPEAQQHVAEAAADLLAVVEEEAAADQAAKPADMEPQAAAAVEADVQPQAAPAEADVQPLAAAAEVEAALTAAPEVAEPEAAEAAVAAEAAEAAVQAAEAAAPAPPAEAAVPASPAEAAAPAPRAEAAAPAPATAEPVVEAVAEAVAGTQALTEAPPAKQAPTEAPTEKQSALEAAKAAAGSVFKHIGKAAEAAQQEGRALKPTKARTEPKTPTATPKKVPQAAVPRNLVFVTSEVAPWSKTGGLGDVLGSLPVALAARGHRVMVVTPRYANYEEAIDTEKRIDIMGAEVGYFHYVNKGVDWVFVDHPSYPRPGGLYADEHGVYGDNQFRFMLLALAGLEAPLQLPLGERGLYGEDCVFIANDWHAALVPVYLAAKYRAHGVYRNARSIMAIHNLRHQGVFPPTTFASLGLPSGWYNAVEYQYPPHMRQGSYAEEGRSVNMLKGGITTADRVVTVSPGYANEIRTWLGGWGLEGLLNARGPVLNGIVNGIDDEDWNPATDKHLPQNYNLRTFKAGKRACKVALQEELGLPVDADTPLIAFIGRLDYQKGADIVLQAAPWMMSQGVQLVCLGTGSTDLENGLRWLEAAYRDQARGWVGFNVAMSHKITAAADILLMPSRFEPCGLNQLYAMQYGTVPVAHRTGGLGDTVIDFNPEEQSGTGWTFGNCDASGLIHATGLALHTMREYPKDFEGIQVRGMQRDSTWNGAAEQYEELFTWAVMDQPYA